MARNILIFSDGTGQAGGLTPDEKLTNVYKLFRATRCGPDTDVDPEQQLAFYDPGIGSPSSGADIKIGWARWIYNVACQATGLGITRNICDCYAAIVQLYRPGDRIYLFGFSRGAYTARCVGGVLGMCGVPTQMKDGSSLKRDALSTRKIATQAVKRVYQYGSSIKGDPLKDARMELANQFRKSYGSDANGQANAVPYFIGVWDTVAALRSRIWLLVVLVASALAIVAIIAKLFSTALTPITGSSTFGPTFGILTGSMMFLVVATYIATHINLPNAFSSAIPRLSGYGMVFYDTSLNPRVRFARHAMSIDENRADFARVPWLPPKGGPDGIAGVTEPLPLKQVWFAGNHSDIGGSYSENESRLSDISFQWMVEQTQQLPDPLLINPLLLSLHPSCAGPQHDEVKNFISNTPRLLAKCIGWKVGARDVPNDAPLHPTVIARFGLGGVQQHDVTVPYRPESLRNHRDVKNFYEL
jgi:uncharacterized protein (DUF2235 family)